MAHGSREDLWAMYQSLFESSSPLSNVLNPEEADDLEAAGYKVVRIPIAPRAEHDPSRDEREVIA